MMKKIRTQVGIIGAGPAGLFLSLLGLNLAVADVYRLAHALAAFYEQKQMHLLDFYSATCLRRVWHLEYFSWWMASILHHFPNDNAFQQRMQHAQLDYIVNSRVAATSFAENYTGLPYEWL